MRLTKLHNASITAIQVCMKVRKKEKILIVTDVNKREIGQAIFDSALHLGYEVFYTEMKPLTRNGEEPPEIVADLMKKYDVVFAPTTVSLTHTDARRAASAGGTRVASLPGITKDVMIRGLSADYNKIARLSIKLKRILDKGKHVRITAPSGTDITFSIKGMEAIASKGLFHKKGESGNLPTGETFLAPVEGSANGVFVVDGSMAGLGLMKNAKLKIEVKDGDAVKITGSQAKKLNDMLNKAGKGARNIAEFGIGTNDTAKLSGLLLEDEKVAGTVHLALGNNITMGGTVNVPIHLDGVIKKPTVYLDDKLLMDSGKLLVEA